MSARDAGRELDAEIAVKVMGLQNVGYQSNAHHTEFEPHTDGTNIRRVQLRHYSTDIAAAWLVVEAMQERDGLVWEFFADGITRGPSPLGWSDAQGTSLAICLAALNALEVAR